MGDKTTKAVFHGRLTGVGVIGEIPQGESSDKQDEQEQALGMLAFNSQGEETGQEGSREQAAREVSEVRGEERGGTRGLSRHTQSTARTFYKHTSDQRQPLAASLCHLHSDRQFPREPGLMTFPRHIPLLFPPPAAPSGLRPSVCLPARSSLLAYCHQPSEAGRHCWASSLPRALSLQPGSHWSCLCCLHSAPFRGPLGLGAYCFISSLPSPWAVLLEDGGARSSLTSVLLKVVPVS